MEGQMVIGQALEQYVSMDLANSVLGQCWSICYDRNLTRDELVGGTVDDAKQRKMEACQRKCVARHFEVLKLVNEARMMREKEALQGLPPGSLSE